MPTTTVLKNSASSGALTTFLSMISEGSDSAVTAIMNASTVPRPTPLATRASAIGRVPKISAYMGTPTRVASGTDHQLAWPSSDSIQAAGIQLWMAAPMPTPISTYSQTRRKISATCWRRQSAPAHARVSCS